MQTTNKLLDDLARVASGALGVAAGMRDEAETAMRQHTTYPAGIFRLSAIAALSLWAQSACASDGRGHPSRHGGGPEGAQG